MALGAREAKFWGKIKKGLGEAGRNAGMRILIDRIESGRTSRGIADAHATDPEYGDAWIELKVARHRKINITPLQADWLTRRSDFGSRCRIVVLYEDPKEQKRILIWSGKSAHLVRKQGINLPCPAIFGEPFDWARIRRVIFSPTLDASS